MNFMDWVTRIERINAADYVEFPAAARNKIKDNYLDYCYTNGVAARGVF